MKILNLIKPNTNVRSVFFSSIKCYKTHEDNPLKVTLLLPDIPEHFELFKKVITSDKIAPYSIRLQKSFHLEQIKNSGSDLNIEAITKNEESTYKIAIENFFSSAENQTKLSNLYHEITANAKYTGLGYYAFHDKKNHLLGGAILELITPEDKTKKAVMEIQIVSQKQGFGTTAVGILLKKAFEESELSEVWGVSTKNNTGAFKICSQYSMMIQQNEKTGMQYYLLTRELWGDIKKNFDKIRTNPIAASTFYADRMK